LCCAINRAAATSLLSFDAESDARAFGDSTALDLGKSTFAHATGGKTAHNTDGSLRFITDLSSTAAIFANFRIIRDSFGLFSAPEVGFVKALADVNVVANPEHAIGSTVGRADASATLDYSVALDPLLPTPLGAALADVAIPVIVTFHLKTEGRGVASGSILGSDGSPIGGVSLASGLAPNFRSAGDETSPVEIGIGSGIAFSVELFAEADAETPDGSSYHAEATVDPIFSFDQPAFDALAASDGFPTFPLDQYFGFEFSPGLLDLGAPTSAAEPGPLLPLSAGLIALRAIARRRKRNRVPG
jgi:hypothetical protein